MDAITDVFVTMQVASVVHARIEATTPWALKRDEDMPHQDRLARTAHSPLQYAHFGMVSRGHCWLSVEGVADALPLASSDCFLLAPGSRYTVQDPIGTPARSFCEVAPTNGSPIIEYGGGGSPTTIISGWFQFDPSSAEALKRLLPPMLLVRADQAQSLALHTTIEMLASEMANPTPGSDLVVNRLADVLFIQCIRAYNQSRSEPCKSGLLRAIFDPQIGVAIKAMHEAVEFQWTVETLAATSGMSRSAFAQRFKETVGESPLEYLTKWRIQKATALLRKGDKKLAEVARAVGYDTDAAFSKAFKRILGVAPRTYGKTALQSPESNGAVDASITSSDNAQPKLPAESQLRAATIR